MTTTHHVSPSNISQNAQDDQVTSLSTLQPTSDTSEAAIRHFYVHKTTFLHSFVNPRYQTFVIRCFLKFLKLTAGMCCQLRPSNTRKRYQTIVNGWTCTVLLSVSESGGDKFLTLHSPNEKIDRNMAKKIYWWLNWREVSFKSLKFDGLNW